MAAELASAVLFVAVGSGVEAAPELSDATHGRRRNIREAMNVTRHRLAILHDDKQKKKTDAVTETSDDDALQDGGNGEAPGIEQRVEQLTCALSPILPPMIESLGALDIDAEFTEPVGASSE